MALLIIIFALSLSSLLYTSISNPNHKIITASLSSFPYHRHSPNLSVHLHRLSAASLDRARRLKEPTLLRTPLSPRGYGGYSVSLGLGSPPQAVPAVMDTGSSLVWVPCTSRYLCSGCSSGAGKSKIKTFSPEKSFSSRNVSCGDPQCAVVFGPGVESGCGGGGGGGSEQCLAYLISYGSGSSFGFLITDELDFGGKMLTDRSFLFGCSVFSSGEPSGIAGFGGGTESLPKQLGVKKFSYCALSHQFDDKPKTTDLILDTTGGDAESAGGMTYAPFRKNPARFKDYYYLTLRQVIVGDKTIDVPSNFTVPGRDGNGGAIVDSGTTFTYMERPLFDRVAGEFERQMSRFERAFEAETVSGLGPCYDLSAGSVPKLTLVFQSGAKMVLPSADYFSTVGTPGALCLTIVSNDAPAAKVVGPAIILGNYQQQDFYVEYDLEKNRFGFKKKTCG